MAFMLACTSDPCKNTDCKNGFCNDGVCDCQPFYEGESCEIEARQKFIGNWSGKGTTQGQTANTNVSISKGQTEKIFVFDGYDIEAELITNTSFDITGYFTNDGVLYNVSGSGHLKNAVLNYTLYLNDGNSTILITYELTRNP